MPTIPSTYTSATPIPDGQTINISQITIEAGTWLLIAHGRNNIPTGTITFAYPYNLRYNITTGSQTYGDADTYLEYVNLTFQSSISMLPYYNFSIVVKTAVTTNYYVTCSPLYGNGASTTGGNNIQIGTLNKLIAVRIA